MDSWLEHDGKGQWTAYRCPFFHVRATNVFAPHTYNRLSAEFAGVLGRSTDGTTSSPKMVKSQPAYDALILAMNAQLSGCFAPLFGREWICRLGQLLKLPVTSLIDGALHHVPQGSRSGWLHTDLCSAWFDALAAVEGDVTFADGSRCDYFTGARRTTTAEPKEFVRAATMIYYLNNDDWRQGDGGETGLYSTSRSDLGPTKFIAPQNNSLILFECSPHSFHRLLGNPGCSRNSIVLWLHATLEFAEARWGDAIRRMRSP
jgi:2OG-Fe(II) oxygenase superfamily